MNALPKGTFGPVFIVGPGEIAEALNPVIDFQRETVLRDLQREINARRVSARTKEHRLEDQD